jgi:predicted molibdopterin-dependent oxidoreductase YjgC
VAGLASKDGTFVNGQERVQRFDVAIVPPPVVRTDLEVLLHLGKRWGVFDTRWTARDVFERMRDSVPGYDIRVWDSQEVAGFPPSASPVSAYDALLSARLDRALGVAAETATPGGTPK